MEHAEALRQAAMALSEGDIASASVALSSGFSPPEAPRVRRSWPKKRLLKLFLRDCFMDQYFGTPLAFPGALRAMSVLAPNLVPYHPNWKQSACHPAYWLTYPTLDHVKPLARGGDDEESNAVTTSMLRNAIKANWTLDELGWSRTPAAPTSDWDGLLPWFCHVYEARQQLKEVPALREWYRAARSAA